MYEYEAEVKGLLNKLAEERLDGCVNITENNKILFERIILKLLEKSPGTDDRSVAIELGAYNKESSNKHFKKATKYWFIVKNSKDYNLEPEMPFSLLSVTCWLVNSGVNLKYKDSFCLMIFITLKNENIKKLKDYLETVYYPKQYPHLFGRLKIKK